MPSVLRAYIDGGKITDRSCPWLESLKMATNIGEEVLETRTLRQEN
jgi:hypothetical protein